MVVGPHEGRRFLDEPDSSAAAGPPPGGFDGKFSGPSQPPGGGPPGGAGGGPPGGGPPPAWAPPVASEPYRLPSVPLSYAPRQSHPLGVAALVCGLLAYPTGCCCHLFGLPLSIAAITCGIVGLTRVRAEPDRYTGPGLCITGIVLGGVSIAFVVAAVALGMSLKLFDALRP